jgi:hypothetical protein
MKNCTKCGVEKPLLDFYSHPKTQDGKQSSCKVCCIKTQKPYSNIPQNLKRPKSLHQPKPKRIKKINPVKEWRENNPEYMREYMKVWRENHPKYIQNYTKKRRNTDPIFKISHNIRSMIPSTFKRGINGIYKKGKKTEYILGCTLEEFIQHLQNQFTEGMTLENHGQGPGKWNIDHITPISSAQTEEEIYKLNHYTNLQPLWWEENMAKGAKGMV